MSEASDRMGATMTDQNATEAAPDAEAQSAAKSSARRVGLIVIILLVLLVAFYAMADRATPSTSRGIVSANLAQIAPRVSGEVTALHVADDAVVEAQAPLFSIDPRPYELAVRQARADLANALQSVDASSASLVAAQAAVTQARSARSQAERVFRLESRGVVAEARGDDARASVTQAEAQLASAEANLESARNQLGPKGKENPAIQAAEARLDAALYDLASTTVTAPHRGVVTNVTLSDGQFIGAGNPAMTFIDAEAAWVTVDLRENQLQKVTPGDPAHLLFDAVPGRILSGRVQSIAWGINPGRTVQGGLVVSQPSNRWFEPARRIPVRIELDGGIEAWPRTVRVGGKVHAVIFADGSPTGLMAWPARAMQRMRSWASFLH
ncbi:HlyD family secretion protein [Paracoccus jeotgali]|nr:HlyD family secretion protein [Paracoccus jeotgali]